MRRRHLAGTGAHRAGTRRHSTSGLRKGRRVRRAATIGRRHRARLWDSTGTHGRTDRGPAHVWRRRALARWSSARLDRVLRQAGSGHNTLMCAIHADAEGLRSVSYITKATVLE